MRKAARLFEIIQILRAAKRPVTAERVAERLEVGVRSIYRDIAALQAMRVPIDGERGLGYILRPGFDLPPLMFTAEEMEAVLVGLALLERTGDRALARAGERIAAKVAAVVPAPLRRALEARALRAWGPAAPAPQDIDFAMIRGAIREERKIDLSYRDAQGRATRRIVRPFALIYLDDGAILVTCCELRRATRGFRVERIAVCTPTGEYFLGEGERLRAEWAQGALPRHE